jgi:hypothetical protein
MNISEAEIALAHFLVTSGLRRAGCLDRSRARRRNPASLIYQSALVAHMPADGFTSCLSVAYQACSTPSVQKSDRHEAEHRNLHGITLS